MVQPDSHSPAVPLAEAPVRDAISKNCDRYEPAAVGMVLRMITVGPTTSTNTARISAAIMLKLEMYWMPLLTPDNAETRNARPSTMMMPSISHVPGFSTRPVCSRPAEICRTPRPSDAAVPKTVAKIARTSMSLPRNPSALRTPMSGMNAAEISWRRPRRYVP